MRKGGVQNGPPGRQGAVKPRAGGQRGRRPQSAQHAAHAEQDGNHTVVEQGVQVVGTHQDDQQTPGSRNARARHHARGPAQHAARPFRQEGRKQQRHAARAGGGEVKRGHVCAVDLGVRKPRRAAAHDEQPCEPQAERHARQRGARLRQFREKAPSRPVRHRPAAFRPTPACARLELPPPIRKGSVRRRPALSDPTRRAQGAGPHRPETPPNIPQPTFGRQCLPAGPQARASARGARTRA